MWSFLYSPSLNSFAGWSLQEFLVLYLLWLHWWGFFTSHWTKLPQQLSTDPWAHFSMPLLYWVCLFCFLQLSLLKRMFLTHQVLQQFPGPFCLRGRLHCSTYVQLGCCNAVCTPTTSQPQDCKFLSNLCWKFLTMKNGPLTLIMEVFK